MVISCSSCIGKLTEIDLERIFEILNAIFSSFTVVVVFGRCLGVLKKNIAKASCDVGYDFGI